MLGFKMYAFFLKPKVVIGFVLFLLFSTAWYVFQDRGKTVVEQKEKIETLEVNRTFTQHDHVIEVENAITQNNAKNRDKKLNELLEEIKHEEKNITDNNVTYDSSLFDRVYLYSKD